MWSLNLLGIVILLSVLSGCNSQADWVPMRINTRTSYRIMRGAAEYIGLRLVRELSAFKKRNGPLYRVTFEGRRPFSMMYTCRAEVHEFVPFRPKVLRYRCWP